MKSCPKCNRTFEDSFSFCLEDGAVLSASNSQADVETLIHAQQRIDFSRPSTKKSTWQVALLVLVSVLALGLIAVLYYENVDIQKSSSSNNEVGDKNIRITADSKPSQKPSNSIIASSETSSDSSADSTLRENSSDNASSDKSTKKITKETSMPKLRQGMNYSKARKLLINSGWQAVVNSPNREFFGSEEYIFNTLKFYEVESCSGTGMGFCRFLFRDVKNRKLVIITANNEEGIEGGPIVNSWSFEN